MFLGTACCCLIINDSLSLTQPGFLASRSTISRGNAVFMSPPSSLEDPPVAESKSRLSSSSSSSSDGNGLSSSFSIDLDMLGEDEKMMIDALRGKNLVDAEFAEEGQKMNLMEMETELGSLPTSYDAQFLDEFFSKRPLMALSRLFTISRTLSSAFFLLLLDAATGKG